MWSALLWLRSQLSTFSCVPLVANGSLSFQSYGKDCADDALFANTRNEKMACHNRVAISLFAALISSPRSNSRFSSTRISLSYLRSSFCQKKLTDKNLIRSEQRFPPCHKLRKEQERGEAFMTDQFIETRGSTPEERRPFRMLVTQQSVQVVHLGVSIGFYVTC